MSSNKRLIVGIALPLLFLTLPVRADFFGDDPPRPFQALNPPTKKEVNHRESLKQYALGLLCLREERLADALDALEKAARLDPEAAAVQKALIPLYASLNRGNEALAACRKVLEINPGDPDT